MHLTDNHFLMLIHLTRSIYDVLVAELYFSNSNNNENVHLILLKKFKSYRNIYITKSYFMREMN